MADSSKDLLNLEDKNLSSSTLESKLIVCKNKELRQTQSPKPQPPDGMPFTSSVPNSQVLGKAKDFLGVFSEANKRLQDDAKDNAKDYDIEVLTRNESEYIEMDLMLGVADLHTPEAVAAAESTIPGYQPVISLAGGSSETESEDSSDDSSDDESDDDADDDDEDDEEDGDGDDGDGDGDGDRVAKTVKRSKPLDDHSSAESPKNCKLKKRPKIIELS